ncbi:hypothetical protein WMY93_011093 [Mugilogobius chulae]|uniref:Fascin-like domain-containing protein n=1 Tax=Mugilogobius chulae TaxID=88201 RepID=A0AAW0PJK8_9GOBI
MEQPPTIGERESGVTHLVHFLILFTLALSLSPNCVYLGLSVGSQGSLLILRALLAPGVTVGQHLCVCNRTRQTPMRNERGSVRGARGEGTEKGVTGKLSKAERVPFPPELINRCPLCPPSLTPTMPSSGPPLPRQQLASAHGGYPPSPPAALPPAASAQRGPPCPLLLDHKQAKSTARLQHGMSLTGVVCECVCERERERERERETHTSHAVCVSLSHTHREMVCVGGGNAAAARATELARGIFPFLADGKTSGGRRGGAARASWANKTSSFSTGGSWPMNAQMKLRDPTWDEGRLPEQWGTVGYEAAPRSPHILPIHSPLAPPFVCLLGGGEERWWEGVRGEQEVVVRERKRITRGRLVKMPANGNLPLKLQFGLINHEGRYLTAESFNFKVNASAPSLKKKQVWTLEQDTKDGQVVYLRSHLGRYLASDKDGKVSCEADGHNSDCRFLISEPHLRFFGGSRDYLSCFAQFISDTELWAVHLALHPQANLLSVARKRYAHLSTEDGEIAVDMNIPWGVAALLTLVYMDGKYCLKTCDSRFLSTAYTLEFKCGKLAFKDCEGKYLSPMGPTGTLRSGRCSKPGKDELFDLEESHPQVILTAANGRFVSIRQGVSLAANQEDETDMETFQMEIEKETKKCTFRTSQGNYWALVAHGGIQSTATIVSADTMFSLEWLGQKVALKACNGKYICTKKNGQLLAVSDSVGEDELLSIKMINRPMLILRGQNASNGAYQIKGVSGKFWYVNSSLVVCSDGEVPEDFFIELVERGRLAIRGRNGKYLRGDPGGLLKGDGLTLNNSVLWEY